VLTAVNKMHPTKQGLLDTFIDLLEQKSIDEITVDDVLLTSGISKGSLYHHYADYSDLVEDALITRYGRFIDQSMQLMHPLLDDAHSSEEFIENLKIITRKTQSDGNAPARMERASLIAKAGQNSRLREKLGKEQNRLNADLRGIVQKAVDKEFFKKDLDIDATVLFIQSYSLGQIINDVAQTPLEKQRWNEYIDRVVEQVFMAKQ
jgi:AcrR family transcriptional regulator